jgi:hypothetical protein
LSDHPNRRIRSVTSTVTDDGLTKVHVVSEPKP